MMKEGMTNANVAVNEPIMPRKWLPVAPATTS